MVTVSMAPKRGAYVYPPGSRVGGKSGKYPINTLKRARAALSYSARSDTAGSYRTVAKAVRGKYGNKVASVGRARGTVSHAGYRKRS
jgi:hypothetical protein